MRQLDASTASLAWRALRRDLTPGVVLLALAGQFSGASALYQSLDSEVKTFIDVIRIHAAETCSITTLLAG